VACLLINPFLSIIHVLLVRGTKTMWCFLNLQLFLQGDSKINIYWHRVCFYITMNVYATVPLPTVWYGYSNRVYIPILPYLNASIHQYPVSPSTPSARLWTVQNFRTAPPMSRLIVCIPNIDRLYTLVFSDNPNRSLVYIGILW
jgi:hypothetical protein